MTSIKVRELLAANIGRIVKVLWDDGDQQNVKIISVDDEGFVYDLVPPDPKTPYWNPFGEVQEVTPDPGGHS